MDDDDDEDDCSEDMDSDEMTDYDEGDETCTETESDTSDSPSLPEVLHSALLPVVQCGCTVCCCLWFSVVAQFAAGCGSVWLHSALLAVVQCGCTVCCWLWFSVAAQCAAAYRVTALCQECCIVRCYPPNTSRTPLLSILTNYRPSQCAILNDALPNRWHLQQHPQWRGLLNGFVEACVSLHSLVAQHRDCNGNGLPVDRRHNV